VMGIESQRMDKEKDGLSVKQLREYDQHRDSNFCLECGIEIFGQPASLLHALDGPDTGKFFPLCEPCTIKRLPPISQVN